MVVQKQHLWTSFPYRPFSLARLNVGNLSQVFSAPVMREREEKRVQGADASMLFEKVRSKGKDLTFRESVNILNDISYLVVPVDQNQPEFRTLLSVIKKELTNDSGTGTQLNFELVEALCRMRVESLTELIRELMKAKKLSRKSKDICVQTLFFVNLLSQHGKSGDREIVDSLISELSFLQLNDIQAEHFNYLVKGFSQIIKCQDFVSDPDHESARKIKEFIPRLYEYFRHELYRCKVSDVLNFIEACHDLWTAKIIDVAEYKEAHEICQLYLDNYLDKARRQINGHEFASILKHIGTAKFHGVLSYDKATVSKLERDFVAYQAENSYFTVTDLLNLLTAFDRVSEHRNLSKLIETITERLPDAIKNSDKDMLKLFRTFARLGLLKLDKYENLCHFVQDYAQSRFQLMDIDDALAFGEFFHEIDLWFWDQSLMAQIDEHFATNYVQYDIKGICRLVRLVGSNYQKSEPLLSLIEDSLRMRLNYIVKNEENWEDHFDAQSISNLVDGLSTLGQASRKRMFSLLKTMVIVAFRDSSKQVLLQEPRLLVNFLKVLSDMRASAGAELRNILSEAISQRLANGPQNWDTEKFRGLWELTNLCLYAEESYVDEAIRANMMAKLKERVEATNSQTLSLPAQQSLALLLPDFQVQLDLAQANLRDTSAGSNLSEVVKEMLSGDVQVSNKQLCDGKLSASLLVTAVDSEKQHIVEIVENGQVHFTQADGMLALRRKGRLADEIAKSHGYSGYSCLSFVELENSSDERQIFDLINAQISSPL